MITPEQLIYDLTNQVEKLEKELAQAQQDIKDFEEAAIEWKDGYRKTEMKYKIELANAQQIIGQLQEELEEARSFGIDD